MLCGRGVQAHQHFSGMFVRRKVWSLLQFSGRGKQQVFCQILTQRRGGTISQPSCFVFQTRLCSGVSAREPGRTASVPSRGRERSL